jgi:hypothetical protein
MLVANVSVTLAVMWCSWALWLKRCTERMAGNAAIRRHVGGVPRLFFCGGLMKTNLSPHPLANIALAFLTLSRLFRDEKNIRTVFVLVSGFHRQRGIRAKRD